MFVYNLYFILEIYHWSIFFCAALTRRVYTALYFLNLYLVSWQGFLNFLLNNLALRFLGIISASDIQGWKSWFITPQCHRKFKPLQYAWKINSNLSNFREKENRKCVKMHFSFKSDLKERNRKQMYDQLKRRPKSLRKIFTALLKILKIFISSWKFPPLFLWQSYFNHNWNNQFSVLRTWKSHSSW